MDYGPPGSSLHGILQARILQWSCHASPSWDLSDPGVEPASPALAGRFFILSHLGSPRYLINYNTFSLNNVIIPVSWILCLNWHFKWSDQISHSVVSDSLWPHESQHARPPCPSPTPGVHSNSRPLSQWCHPAISSSVIPFSSCPQSLPVSGYFPISQLLAWGGNSTGVTALASFLPTNSQG